MLWEHAANDAYRCNSTLHMRCLLESFVNLVSRPIAAPATILLLILWPCELPLKLEDRGYFRDVVAPLLNTNTGSDGPRLVAFNTIGWVQQLRDATVAAECVDSTSSSCAQAVESDLLSLFTSRTKRGRSCHPSTLAHSILANVLAQLLLTRASPGLSSQWQHATAPPLTAASPSQLCSRNGDGSTSVHGEALNDDESSILLEMRLRDRAPAFLSWVPGRRSSFGPLQLVRGDGGGTRVVTHTAPLGDCLASRIDCKAGVRVPACDSGELLRINLTSATAGAAPLRTTALNWKADLPLRLVGELADGSTTNFEQVRQVRGRCFRTTDKLAPKMKDGTIDADSWWLSPTRERPLRLVALTACSPTRGSAELHWLVAFAGLLGGRHRARDEVL